MTDMVTLPPLSYDPRDDVERALDQLEEHERTHITDQWYDLEKQVSAYRMRNKELYKKAKQFAFVHSFSKEEEQRILMDLGYNSEVV